MDDYASRIDPQMLSTYNYIVKKPSFEQSFNTIVFDKFKFVKPPECPVYRPTPEQFAAGPMQFIRMISPEAQNFGICKIIPPENFKVPFSLSTETFRFNPRIQELDEIEAVSRVKFKFYKKVLQFWKMYNVKVNVPLIDGVTVDMYTLHKLVKDACGFICCQNLSRWGDIAVELNLPQSNAIKVSKFYEKYLYPFELSFEDNSAVIIPVSDGMKFESSSESSYDLSNIISNSNKELRNLIIKGTGPKMSGFSVFTEGSKTRNNRLQNLKCSNCKRNYYIRCHVALKAFRRYKKWICPICANDYMRSIKMEDFCFPDSLKDYSLQEFAEQANVFKQDYFLGASNVSADLLEREYWRILSTVNKNNVSVQYGIDLDTSVHGSGFPKSLANVSAENAFYVSTPWNLNNISRSDGSVFKHFDLIIDGMVKPWIYTGMCFSTFCWHVEDQFSFSISYMHHGDSKTWYGVPGSYAEMFERAAKQLAPELFEKQPALLHELVTSLNPNLLSQFNIPVFRTDQRAGEFVVSFPRAYHTGFNQGFNLAESVNFATNDWFPFGRISMENYSFHKRCPVFSHAELVFNVAEKYRILDNELRNIISMEIKYLVKKQNERLNQLFHLIPVSSVKLHGQNIRCNNCQTNCYLCAVLCSCETPNVSCLQHIKTICEICSTSELQISFRYSTRQINRIRRKLYSSTRSYSFNGFQQ